MTKVERIGPFVEILDEEGCRHLVRISSIQWLSDSDQCRDETLLTAAGRTIHIPETLDEVRNVIGLPYDPGAGMPKSGSNI